MLLKFRVWKIKLLNCVYHFTFNLFLIFEIFFLTIFSHFVFSYSYGCVLPFSSLQGTVLCEKSSTDQCLGNIQYSHTTQLVDQHQFLRIQLQQFILGTPPVHQSQSKVMNQIIFVWTGEKQLGKLNLFLNIPDRFANLIHIL